MRYLPAIPMKHLLLIVFAVFVSVSSISAFADQYVHGYSRSNGHYVQPYYRSSPNNTVTDNFSYHGNVNPYTGRPGTNYYLHDRTSPYYLGPDSHGRVGHKDASVTYLPTEGAHGVSVPLGRNVVPLSAGEWVPMRQSTPH